MQKRSSSRRVARLAGVLALLGTACSGGASDKTAISAEPSNAQAPGPGSAGSAPAEVNSTEAGSPASTENGAAAPPLSAPSTPTAGSPVAPAAKAPVPGRDSAPSSPGPAAGPDAKGNAGAAPAAGGGTPSTPASAASPAGAKPNYASDAGVTADTIRIGTINMTSATRSLGPAFAGVQEQNLDAAVKYINRTGGVAGRKLQLVTCDDGGDIARGRACYEKLKDNVFALVPSITWITDTIHDRLGKDKLPWLSWGWFKSEYEDPWMFPCHANGIREASATADWVAKVIKPKNVGIMYLNVSEDIAARDVATKQLAKYGIDVVATVAQEWDSPDESQHVLAMRAADPEFILSFSWPAPVAKFFHDASAQKWAPKLGYIANHLIGDPGYGAIFGDYTKERVYSITSWGVPTGPDPENADGNTPEQKLLMDELIRTNGREYQGFKWRYGGYHHITQSGWVCVKILAKAAQSLGADLTREGLRKALETKAGGWDSGLGVTLHWLPGDHNANPYSFNREFIYKWVSASDGGYDFKRIRPDPVYDCAGGNIPAEAKTIC